VGGQALAVWAQVYEIQPVGELSRNVTTDADFIGTSKIALELKRALGPPWKMRKADPDEPGEQVAKVFAAVPDEGLKQVDFLSGILGLETDGVKRRGVEITLGDGLTIRVLHPLDVLESRLRNLDGIPAKRNEIGVAQATLAVQVARAFIDGCVDNDRRVLKAALQRIEQIVLDQRLSSVAWKYEIDVLAALPVDRIPFHEFQTKQLPGILARLERRHAKLKSAELRRRAIVGRHGKSR